MDTEKKRIIQEVLTLRDEWIIKAIKKLLDLDLDDKDDFSEEQR